MENLYVKPEFRSQDISRFFILHLAKQAKKINCSRLEWLPFANNKRVSKLYSELGAVTLNGLNIVKCDDACIDNMIAMSMGV